MDHRFVLAGIAGCDRTANEFAAQHLARHFGFEQVTMALAPGVIEIARNRGATGLVVTGIDTNSEAASIRANGGMVIHLRKHCDARINPVSYDWRTDRFVVDIGDPERVQANLEVVVVETIKTVQRRYGRAA